MDGRFCPITSSVILKMFKLPRASSMKRLCHVCQKKGRGGSSCHYGTEIDKVWATQREQRVAYSCTACGNKKKQTLKEIK